MQYNKKIGLLLSKMYYAVKIDIYNSISTNINKYQTRNYPNFKSITISRVNSLNFTLLNILNVNKPLLDLFFPPNYATVMFNTLRASVLAFFVITKPQPIAILSMVELMPNLHLTRYWPGISQAI